MTFYLAQAFYAWDGIRFHHLMSIPFTGFLYFRIQPPLKGLDEMDYGILLIPGVKRLG